ncbi:ribulose-phosphate 3-epimerase [Helicobacter suis]|uniref:ribulose-phosphate 3-epimerase n=1 Tax=Helicobacter suis TaxID=104628 RepID=UPI0031FBB32D
MVVGSNPTESTTFEYNFPMEIAASILSADFMDLKQSITRVHGVDLLHVDVMDGHFVPNLTFGPCVLKNLDQYFNIPLDIHLMVDDPLFCIDLYSGLRPSYITIHLESTPHIHKTIHYIKSLGFKAGISLNPATPLCGLEYILDDLDLVLFMSVNPGFGGQKFLPLILNKITHFKQRFSHYAGKIEVDGGINADNAKDLWACGVDILVVGSYLFTHEDPALALKELRKT